MSTAVNQKPLTIPQRTSQAAEQAATYLRLENAKLVGAVLAEVAADELRLNGTFAERVRSAYEAATAKPMRTARQTRTPKPKQPKAPLTPRKGMETHQINIAAPVDPYYLYDVFGEDQLPQALDMFSKQKLLDEAVLAVQKRHVGATLSAKATKPAVIAFIVRYVTSK